LVLLEFGVGKLGLCWRKSEGNCRKRWKGVSFEL